MNYFWTHPSSQVRPSPIHGKGRFAQKKITAGAPVVIAGGHVLERSRVTWSTGLLIDKDFILQMPEACGYEAYLNHSCEPNCHIHDTIIFRASRDIEIGEELTVDYATFMATKKNIEDNCRCGSPRCRKIISGSDWQRKDLQTAYRGKFSTYVQSLIDHSIQENAHL